MNENNLDYRFLARIVIEAETPLSVKSGEKSVVTDAVVIKDVNGLPYIPGSSIAGVIRHAWKETKEGKQSEKDIFGYQQGEKGAGSRIIFSEARIINAKGKVMDGMVEPKDIKDDEVLKYYDKLPIRQHVKINHRGTADTEKSGKFDEQVVFSGTRFCFEMEMLGCKEKEEEDTFKELLKKLYHTSFRLGSGTRNGFGKIKVVSIQYDALSKNDERYLNKSSNLEESRGWYGGTFSDKEEDKGWTSWKYELTPNDFFLFGSGFGNEDADMTPITETKVDWENNPAKVKEHVYLLPATSIKGAIAHRVAYHYNRLTNVFAEDFNKEGRLYAEGKTMNDYVGCNNVAVRLLFGYEGDAKMRKIRGNVLFSDLYDEKKEGKDKILNHVAIDRFTGGAIDGALFSEKTVYGNKKPFILEILVNKEEIRKLAKEEGMQKLIKELYKNETDEDVFNKTMEALTSALDDLCNGLLPLGGGVNRGNGMFHGKLIEPKQEEAK